MVARDGQPYELIDTAGVRRRSKVTEAVEKFSTIKALQAALNLGMQARLVLHTPLMWIDKAQTWGLTQDLGGAALVELIRHHSHSCYVGDRSTEHDWGFGCGSCPACDLRADGWARWRAA